MEFFIWIRIHSARAERSFFLFFSLSLVFFTQFTIFLWWILRDTVTAKRYSRACIHSFHMHLFSCRCSMLQTTANRMIKCCMCVCVSVCVLLLRFARRSCCSQFNLILKQSTELHKARNNEKKRKTKTIFGALE